MTITGDIILVLIVVWIFCWVAFSVGLREAVRLWAELTLAIAVTALLLGWQPW